MDKAINTNYMRIQYAEDHGFTVGNNVGGKYIDMRLPNGGISHSLVQFGDTYTLRSGSNTKTRLYLTLEKDDQERDTLESSLYINESYGLVQTYEELLIGASYSTSISLPNTSFNINYSGLDNNSSASLITTGAQLQVDGTGFGAITKLEQGDKKLIMNNAPSELLKLQFSENTFISMTEVDGVGRVNITNLPKSLDGLSIGDIWIDGDTLRIKV